MSDENTMIATDSLLANEFHVELDGHKLLGVFRVSGLTTFRLGADSGKGTITLSKMVQRDGNNVFNKWLRETISSAGTNSQPKRTIAVVAVDDGVETRRWTIKDASITEVSYTEFDTASSEMIQEIVTIQYNSLEEAWPATARLE